MADDELQPEAVVPEAGELGRWTVKWIVGSAGVSFLCTIPTHVVHGDPISTLLVFLLNLSSFIILLISGIVSSSTGKYLHSFQNKTSTKAS